MTKEERKEMNESKALMVAFKFPDKGVFEMYLREQIERRREDGQRSWRFGEKQRSKTLIDEETEKLWSEEILEEWKMKTLPEKKTLMEQYCTRDFVINNPSKFGKL